MRRLAAVLVVAVVLAVGAFVFNRLITKEPPCDRYYDCVAEPPSCNTCK